MGIAFYACIIIQKDAQRIPMEPQEKEESGKEVEPKEAEKYSFSEVFDYLAKGVYPVGADKSYKHGLRKRSKFFAHKDGRLVYIGRQKKASESVTGEGSDSERSGEDY